MMYSKQEKRALQLIAAAVLLGVFTLNPMAQAFDLQAPIPQSDVTVILKNQDRLEPAMQKGDRQPAAKFDVAPVKLTASAEANVQQPAAPISESRIVELMEKTLEKREAAAREQNERAVKEKEAVVTVARPEVAVEREEKDGMSLSEINKILREPLAVKANEKKTNVSFLGDVPARCVYDTEGNMTASIDYDKAASKEGQHVFRVRMPLCERDPNFKRKPGEKMVKVSEIPGARQMNDVKGKIVLASGYKDSDAEPTLEEIKSKSGSVVEIETDNLQRMAEEAALRADREKAANKAAEDMAKETARLEKQQREEEARQRDRHIKEAEDYCKKQDIDGLDRMTGNLPELSEHMSGITRSKLYKDINAAESDEDAKAAWEAYSEAGDRLSWDDDQINKGKNAYIEKRFSLITAAMGDSDGEGDGKGKGDAERMVDDWASDLKDLDSRTYSKRKGDIAKLYENIALGAANGEKKNSRSIGKNTAAAERAYEKARKHVGKEDKNRIEGALAKINAQAFRACIAADPMNMVACEKKFREKVTKHSERYAQGLKRQADNGDEAAAAEVQAFAAEYLQAEGFGASFSYGAFGTIHQMPGSFERAKMQSLQDMQMRMYQENMQRMMGGGMMNMGGMQQRTPLGL